MKTYTIQEMREMLDKYIHKNSDGWGHNELLEVRNYINYFLYYVEKQVEKSVPKIEYLTVDKITDFSELIASIANKQNEIIRYINNNK